MTLPSNAVVAFAPRSPSVDRMFVESFAADPGNCQIGIVERRPEDG
jgi:hypothetical protein